MKIESKKQGPRLTHGSMLRQQTATTGTPSSEQGWNGAGEVREGIIAILLNRTHLCTDLPDQGLKK